MTYSDALAYLESFVDFERRHQPKAMRAVRLERMQRLCQRLGDPQRRFRSILVAGTNGKGSICAMLYSMLRESQLRVGLYTSPHVEHLRERFRAWTQGPQDPPRRHGDDWISEQEFADAVERLWPVLEEMRDGIPEQAPTYFEILTAVAFLHFGRQQVDVAVLEVGLGGRLDATNVVQQAVSVFGPINLDHMEILGATAPAIAREKAGILKPGQLAISSPQSPEVLAVLEQACAAQGVPLVVCGRDVTVRVADQDVDRLELSVTSLRGIYEGLELPLIGTHQAENAAVAIAALEALSGQGAPTGVIERGLNRVTWPGRIEVVHDSPLVIMDGGHNPGAADALHATLAQLCPGRRIHLLIGVSADKSVEEIGRRLGPLAVSATCTASRHPRALSPVALAQRLAPFCADVHAMTDPLDAYTYLLNAVSRDDVIVVAGSFFLVGELRAALRQSHIKPRRAALAAA